MSSVNPAFEATATFAAPLAVAPGIASRPSPAAWLLRLLRPARGTADATDPSTGLYNRPGLFAAVGDAQARAGSAHGAGVILLEFDDLREVFDIYGAVIARKVVARIVRRLRLVAGSRGFAARTGPAQFCVVLPSVGEEKALRRLQRGFGKPARVEFDAGDSEIVLVPSVLVDATDPGTGGVPGLYRQMCHDLARIRKDEHRRLHYLASERERHSRPLALQASR